MKRSLFAGIVLLLAQHAWAQSADRDAMLVQSVGLKSDGSALLDYFRQLTHKEAEPREMARLIRLLRSDSFTNREQGQKELLELGPAALGGLIPLYKDADTEARVRALAIRDTLLEKVNPSVQAASARLIGASKPKGAVEVLLRFLPCAADETVIDEVCSAITETAMPGGRADPFVIKCLNDPSPFKRAAAAESLVRGRSAEHLPAIRKLLQDADPQVRLRVGVALAVSAKDKEALPVLVELLGVLEPEQLWKVEAVLKRLAGDNAPNRLLGANDDQRKKCRDAWHAWLTTNGDKIDLARLDRGIDPVTVAVYERLGAKYGGWAKNDTAIGFEEGRQFAEEGIPGFQFTTFPTTRPPIVAVPFGLEVFDANMKTAELRELASLRSLTVLFVRNAAVNNEGLEELAHAPSLATLQLGNAKVTDAGLKNLASFKSLTSLHLNNAQITNAGLKQLGRLKALTTLSLTYTQVSDAGLKELLPLDNLKTLFLYHTNVTWAGLKELMPLKSLTTIHVDDGIATDAERQEPALVKKLATLEVLFTPTTPYEGQPPPIGRLARRQFTDTNLRVLREMGVLHTSYLATGKDGVCPSSPAEVTALSLHSTRLADSGMKQLEAFKNLVTLDLGFTQVADAGLKELAAFKNLTTLNLSYTPATDAGLKELAPLTNLTTLYLEGTNMTNAGLKELAPLKNLTVLFLGSRKLTDAGMKYLSPLTRLTTLRLSYTDVTDAGLKELAGLRNLTTIDLRFTGVTDAGVAELQKSLPACQILR